MENNYKKIASLVPNGEHFDASAINEGVYLTETHLKNIEASLANQDNITAQMQEQIDMAAGTVKTANDAVAAANETIQAKDETIAAKDAEIKKLQDEVSDLKKQPAGSFSAQPKEKDDLGGGQPKELDPVTKEANIKRKAMGLPEIKP